MILTKVQLVSNINTELSDNSTGQISPYDIRHNLLDIIDSVHLLTGDKNLQARNFSTPSTRTTLAGERTIENLLLNGYSSVDNSAFGHSALKSNHTGYANTAIGSNALSCNIRGIANVSIGVNALGGNTTGSANVGLGNHTLINNKIGNFNIAIGNAAGYYAARDTNYKLFIASHPIEDGYICANPLGSGLTPLVYGDLNQNNLKFGIAVRELHDYSTLQVSGGIAPYLNDSDNLGHSLRRFNTAYLSNSINFSNSLQINYINSSDIGVSGNVVIKGNFIPESDNLYTLGNGQKTWAEGHFENIYVSGQAKINTYLAIENSNYVNKTIYIAASGGDNTLDGGGANGLLDYFDPEFQNGHPFGYLTDGELIDAGLIIKSSSSNRDYKFTFLPPNSGSINCIANNPYNYATWNSNISLVLDTGRYLRTNNIVGYSNLSISLPSNCYGLHIESQFSNAALSSTSLFLANKTVASATSVAGFSDVNFVCPTGQTTGDYTLTIASLESGVSLSQRFLNGTKNKTLDTSNNNKEKLDGFEIKYIDDLNANIFGNIGLTDRLAIGSYNDSSEFKNAVILMKDSDNGVFGITNFNPLSENFIPNTIFNVRSSDDAIIRATAENVGSTEASIQLLGEENCEFNGAEFTYRNGSGIADINMFVNSGENLFVRLYENNRIGLFTPSGTTNEMLTLGDDFSKNAVVSLHFASGNIVASPSYSKVFVKPKVKPRQDHSIYLLDGSGYLHDLVVNKYDSSDGRALFTDNIGNTFGGAGTDNPRNISSPLGLSSYNTAYGFAALASVSGGDYNIAVGYNAGFGNLVGDSNIYIGDRAGQYIASGDNNIIIGKNSYALNSENYQGNYNIVLGSEVLSEFHSGDYNLVIGHGSDSDHLIRGVMGPTNDDKRVDFQHANVYYHKTTDQVNQNIYINHSGIKINDLLTKQYPDQSFSIGFMAASGNDLFLLSHSGALPVSGTPTYATDNPSRPYGQFNSDLRIQGAIRFSDSTSLESASFLEDITILQSGVSANTNALSNIFIEGYIQSEIKPPLDPLLPTSGYLVSKNSDWTNGSTFLIRNRDVTSSIHGGAYVIAIKINNEYRPIWISANTCENSCNTC
jgi:hypothetical protein